MACKAPSFMRVATCPGPTGDPASKRCKRCARGPCEAPGQDFNASCCGPDATSMSFVCHICMRKAQLVKRRGSISGLMGQGGITGQNLQEAWTARVGTIVEQLWDECMDSAAPCNYAVALAGSGARREASPYSDLDFFILVEDSKPANVQFFVDVSERMRDVLTSVEGNSGLRLCNIMSPLGSPGNPKAPQLIRTPHDMADLVEWPPDQIEGHISGGLLEHAFLLGTQQLYNDFKTDLNVIVAKTCFTFSSRLTITQGKLKGLKVISDLVNDPRFTPPQATDDSYHVKEQFYRPPQFIAKGLSWFYAVNQVATSYQLNELVQGNHMSTVNAQRFTNVLNEMAKLRFKLHLDSEGEKDFVYTDKAKRDLEVTALEVKGTNRTAAEKERLNRLKGGTLLTNAELAGLRGVIPDLAEIMRLARKFVKEKEKLLGKRVNPFA